MIRETRAIRAMRVIRDRHRAQSCRPGYWTRLWTVYGPYMDPIWTMDPLWTPYGPYGPYIDPIWTYMDLLWTLYGPPWTRTPVWALYGPPSGPYMDPVCFPVWTVHKPYMDPRLGPIWTLYGPYMDPIWTVHRPCSRSGTRIVLAAGGMGVIRVVRVIRMFRVIRVIR